LGNCLEHKDIMLTFFEVHFSAILAIGVMWVWHFIANSLVSLRRNATLTEKQTYALFVTIERWLGYFVIFVCVYIYSW